MTHAPRWLELLRAEVGRAGSVQAVADLVGVSRPAISSALAGSYPAKTTRLEARVLARLERVDCPHLSREIEPAACRTFRTRAMPRSDPSALRHWVACRRCPIGARLSAAEKKGGAA